ncbi:MAG: hypothetical protein HC888_12200, partial [Candidatus Competibacteraceae bacterium]|nr:hypothetical protein [Candidatus Competibacteraceae bacterium]
INKIGGGIMDIIQRSLAPTVVSRLSSVSKPAWDKFFPDAPGQKLLLNGAGNPTNDIKYMDTPQIPPYVQQFLGQYLMPEFDKHAGTMDMTQIAGKKQAPGGDTIEQMRDTMQSAYQLKGRFIERALTDAGTLAVSNVFQYYTQSQRMKLLGEDGLTLQDFDFDPGTLIPSGLTREQRMMFWKNFAMTILPGSLHSGAQDRQKLIQTNLFGMGAISRAQLLRTLEIGDAEKIQKELNEEKTQDILAQGRAQMLIQNQSAMEQLGQQLSGAMPSPGGMPEAEDPQASARLSRGARNGQPV